MPPKKSSFGRRATRRKDSSHVERTVKFHRIKVIPVSETETLAALPADILLDITERPHKTRDKSYCVNNPRAIWLRDWQGVGAAGSRHEGCQRPWEKIKKNNGGWYKEYLRMIRRHDQVGIVPPILLHVESPMQIEKDKNGTYWVLIPEDALIGAFDGETQLAARHMERDDGVSFDPEERIKVILYHGIQRSTIRQYFADLHRFGAAVNQDLWLRMDQRDPSTEFVRQLNNSGMRSFFSDKIHFGGRSLPKRKTDEAPIVTVSAMRVLVRTLVEGSKALNGNSKGLVPQEPYTEDARRVFMDYMKYLTPLVKKYAGKIREGNRGLHESIFYMATTWAALGVVASRALEGVSFKDQGKCRKVLKGLVARIEEIDWSKDRQWDGICLAFDPDSKPISIGGPGASSLRIARAIEDSSSESYGVVRGRTNRLQVVRLKEGVSEAKKSVSKKYEPKKASG